jgi:ATP synthase mitochondrial F1 complex assembly factor 1
MNNFLKFSKKFYFNYPCPRKLREIVKITLFEREQPEKIKEIWAKYYEEKPSAIGMDINAEEMNLIIKK